VVEHRVGWLDPVFVGLTILGYGGFLWIALAPALAHWARRPVLAATALTAACVWTADLLSLLLKVVIARPRPFEVLPGADALLTATVGQSMPSGHAATSFAGALILSALVRRRIAVAGLLLAAAAMAFSRVYVGVHYPADVIVGAALGAAVASAYAAAHEVRARRRLSGIQPRGDRAPRGG